jgi:hypothetical protein
VQSLDHPAPKGLGTVRLGELLPPFWTINYEPTMPDRCTRIRTEGQLNR